MSASGLVDKRATFGSLGPFLALLKHSVRAS